MSWDTLLKLDAANIFASSNMMPGVEVVTLKYSSGDEIVIAAPVFRDEVDDVNGTSYPAPRLRVFVPRTEERKTLDPDALKITVARNVGDTPDDHAVVAVEKQDAAGWLLRLR